MGDPHRLHRRDVLQRAMLLAGLAIMPAEAMAAVAGTPKVAKLGAPDRKLLTAVADTIIPQTDTPGAVAAGVPDLFDNLLQQWASAVHRVMLMDALRRIDATARTTDGKPFAALTAAQRQTRLSAIDAANAQDPGYGKLKELIVTLYYLSEPGSTVELRYEQVPGEWNPSLPVTPDTRTQGGAGLF